MIVLQGIHYLPISEILDTKKYSYEEVLEKLYELKIRRWPFIRKKFEEEGITREADIKKKIMEQFDERYRNSRDLQNIAFRDGMGIIAYISPLLVRAGRKGRWYENPVFDSYAVLTGNGTNRTHDPDGNILVCPEISSRSGLKTKGVRGVGKNLVGYTLLRGYGMKEEKGNPEIFCAYTRDFEPTLRFHQSLGAKVVRKVENAEPFDRDANGSRAIVEYSINAVVAQISHLAEAQTEEERKMSTEVPEVSLGYELYSTDY